MNYVGDGAIEGGFWASVFGAEEAIHSEGFWIRKIKSLQGVERVAESFQKPGVCLAKIESSDWWTRSPRSELPNEGRPSLRATRCLLVCTRLKCRAPESAHAHCLIEKFRAGRHIGITLSLPCFELLIRLWKIVLEV